MCHIIEDLLPLYTEAMVHEDTADFVKDHLENCEQCSEKYQSMIHSSKVPKSDKKLEEQQILVKNVWKNVKKQQRRRIIRKILLIGLIVLIPLIVYCIKQERYNPTYTLVDAQLSKEQIIQECPEILISDKDCELGAFMLNRPETEALFAQTKKEGKIVTMPHEDLENLSSEWPMDECDRLSWIEVYENQISFDYYCESDNKTYLYTFVKGQDTPTEKMISIYSDVLIGSESDQGELVSIPTNLNIIYGNVDGELGKYIDKRLWFAWLWMPKSELYNVNGEKLAP